MLRKTDPRYTAQKEFAERYIKNDSLIDIVNSLYEIVPGVLKKTGKVKTPWPNVDAYSGSLLYHYGIKEHTFYTVIFGVSRALGVLASLITDRLYGMPLERPTSHPLKWYREQADGKGEVC